MSRPPVRHAIRRRPVRRPFLALRLLAVLVAVAPVSTARAQTPAGDRYDPPALLATLDEPAVVESSGLTAGRRDPNLLWTLNDSGDAPHLYATDRTGLARGTFAVTGAANVDWEDLASGPGAGGGDALYVADVGDNTGSRDDLALYRVPEPAPAVEPADPAAEPAPTDPAERFPFAYPDGRHDAETLLVHPVTRETLIVTKETAGPAGVYRFPHPLVPDHPAILVRVGSVSLPSLLGLGGAVTGGAVAPDGDRVTLRTYVAAFEWTIGAGQTLAQALGDEPSRIALPTAARGEAIAYRADSAALLLTSEGAPCPLYEVRRRQSAATRRTSATFPR